MLLLGLTPFMMRLLPARFKPDPERLPHGLAVGAVSMTLMLLTGVSGPLVDSFFLAGGKLDRREVVATKALCQVFGHLSKFAYFGLIIDQTARVDPVLAAFAVGCAILGTSLARRLLEAMTDVQFRLWANRLITVIAGHYVVQGTYLILQP